ncbi:MAG: hypothetical protein ABII06_20745 [Pseudomonadota bacterium]
MDANLKEKLTKIVGKKASYGFLTRINPNLFAEDLAIPMSKIPERFRV